MNEYDAAEIAFKNGYEKGRQEIERLQEALAKAEADVKNYLKVAECQQNLSVKRYHEIKRLKEDIERLEEINERDVENIRLAKQEVARVIFEELHQKRNELWNKGKYTMFETWCKAEEELKKKYTEDKT